MNLLRYIVPKATAVLLFAFFILDAEKTVAQSCNQVEILYTSPDCFEREQHADPGGSSGGKGCKPIAVCVNNLYNYTSSIVLPGWTYNWTATGPSPVTISPSSTASSVNISWPQVGVYALTLTATDPSGNVFTYCLTVNVKDKPVANFNFSPNNVCAGSIISFTNTTTYSGGGVAYSWNFGDPSSGSNNFSTAINPTHQYNSAGTYTVTLIAYSFTTVNTGNPTGGEPSANIKTCCADTITKVVTIKPGTIKIECISTVCAGAKVTYHAVGCTNPTWSGVVGGTINAQAGDSITITWGNGTPQGQIQASCPGGCLASVPVPIIPTNPVIVGNQSPCNTSTTSYTLPVLPGTFYTWTLTNTTSNTNHNNLLNTYPDNNTVWINWASAPPGSYLLTVVLDNKHICCTSTGSLVINPSGKWTAYVDQTICAGSTAGLSVFPAAGTFNWTVLPSNIGVTPTTGTGSSFNPVFSNAGNYIVQVTETANTYCNSGLANPQQIKVKVIGVPTPGTINGAATACIGSANTYTMSSPAPAGYHYEWNVSAGAGTFQPGNLANVNGDAATVLWTVLSGTVSAVLVSNGNPACSSAVVNKNITQATVGTITGTMNVCVDGNGSYTLSGVPSGVTVNWSISPASQGTITSPPGSNPVTILWHGTSGAGPWPASISATTGCGNPPSLTGILVYPKFTFTITKTGTDICQPGGVTLTATGAPSGSTYIWSPGGQTTPSINVTTAGTYSVTATKGGCSFTKQYVVEDPFEIRGITCGIGLCNGTATNEVLGVQVVKPGAGTFTYQWYNGIYPGGSPIGAATGTSYTAPSHGNYYVVVTYGICQKYISFTVKKVCCPNVNNPQITAVVRNSCNSFTFTGTTPNPAGAAITWNFGNGVTMPGTSGVPITYVYPPGTMPGDYCVTFCVGPPSPNPTNCTGNCTSTTVRVPLLAAFSYKLGCNGCLVIDNLSVIAPTSNAATATYNWNFGDGSPVVSTTSATPPNHCYTSPTPQTYTITLTINYSDPSLGLTCSSVATSTVNYAPLDISVNPTPVCTGVQTNFGLIGSPSFSIITSNWSFGDGFNAFTIPTTHIYNSAGTMPVKLTVTDALGNICKDSLNITILPGITSCTILPAYICPGGAATINGPVISGASYLWQYESSPGVFSNATGTNNTINYTTTVPGFYRVIVTASNGCTCTSNKVEVKAVTKPKAIIAASPSSKLCGPGNVMLSSPNHLNGYTSDWYANGNYGTLLSSGMMYFATGVSTTTVYNLILTNEYGCKDTCSMTITVNPIPAPPVISSSPTLCEGVPITLTVTNYASNITWNTGATGTSITVSAAGVYTATYTNPVTGCSSSKNIKINRRPPTDLFPHYCDKIPCTCRDSLGNFTIYAPKPLLGAFAANYNIQWYFNNTAVGTNGNNPSFSPAANGTYHIVVTDPVTGCKDTSNKYSVIVLPCDTCNCDESHWGDILLGKGEIAKVKGDPIKVDAKQKAANVPTGSIKLECKKLYELNCNQPYTLNANYICKDTTCPAKVTFSLQPPTGPPVTGALGYTFTPNQTGTYTATLYGWCGDKICDSCIIDFSVKCDTIPPPTDCCKGSKWEMQPWFYFEGKNKEQKTIDCNKEQTIAISGDLCKQPLIVGGTILCPPNCIGTDSVFVYNNANVLVQSGPAPFSITGLPNGSYTVVVNGYCGGKLCLTCKFFLKVDCKETGCDCKGSKWGERTYTINNTTKAFKCFTPNDKPIDVKCNVPITINAIYNCVGANCPGTVNYTLSTPAGTSTGTLPLNFTPSQTGVYSLTLYGMCGNKVCDTCVVKFKTVCPVDSICCPYNIKVDTSNLTYNYNQQYNATIASQTFTISGLAGVPLTEVRAEVLSYTIADNYEKECMKCANLPYTWASVLSAANIGTVLPRITMYNSTVHPFNPTGAGIYQNPREVVWTSSSTFIINNGTPIGMNFILPPPPLIDCCELKGKICVKFTFRDKDCKECEVISCFHFIIKNKKGF